MTLYLPISMALTAAHTGSPADHSFDAVLDRARRGDRAAAGEVLRHILPRVRNLVRYLVRGDSDVDDMAQQSLIAVLAGLSSFRGESRFEAWADRITVRETLRYKRRVRARAEVAERDVGEHGPDEYLARRRVVRLLDALPEEQRVCLVLHHSVGMSLPEIAKELGVSFDTVKSRIRLATQKLRASEEGP
jgi:RNA polymerase sigma-70 factor (ECF subfamily)